MTPRRSARAYGRSHCSSRSRGRRAACHGRADVYLAIADPTRRRLLDLLGPGERPVNSLAAPFRMSRPAISQHLRVLRQVGLVGVTKHGRERYYRVRGERLREVFDWVAHYQAFWGEKLAALGHYLDRQKESESADES